MDEIGHILREARENKGLTLEEVQAKIRINVRFLAALESGQYDVLPTPVHARGFLRNYARFLGLDPQPLLDRYLTVQSREDPFVVARLDQEITPDNPLPERQDQPFFDPVNMEVNGKGFDAVSNGGGSGSMLQIVIIIALVIALALIANRFIPILSGRGGEPTAGDGDQARRRILTDRWRTVPVVDQLPVVKSLDAFAGIVTSADEPPDNER